jgi:hypothetical protein
MAFKLTPTQRSVLAAVWRAHAAGRWYRAADSGERVTLASLHNHGVLARRAWRGIEGESNAAHEYCVAGKVVETSNQLENGPPKLGGPPPVTGA